MGITKIKLIIVFGTMILIWALSFAIHLYETLGSFRVDNLPYRDVLFIEVNDRGIVGEESIILKNKDSNNHIRNLILSSKPVNSEDINLRANQDQCYIILHYKNHKPSTLALTKSSFSGGILQSGDYFYKNDKFLNLIVSQLKTNP